MVVCAGEGEDMVLKISKTEEYILTGNVGKGLFRGVVGLWIRSVGFGLLLVFNPIIAGENKNMVLKISKTEDFSVTGDGTSSMWTKADALALPLRKGKDRGLRTDLKMLYSDLGLYFLFRCEDEKLTASMPSDFMDLWNEDVAEVFLWPDQSHPMYFEYEISPLDHELVLLVPNLDGDFLGWLPWHYEGERLTRHATSVQGGPKKSGSSIHGWIAEFFIPFALLKPLQNVPPRSGTKWRCNFYRCDYDSGDQAYWSWQPVEKRFHEYEKFGVVEFK